MNIVKKSYVFFASYSFWFGLILLFIVLGQFEAVADQIVPGMRQVKLDNRGYTPNSVANTDKTSLVVKSSGSVTVDVQDDLDKLKSAEGEANKTLPEPDRRKLIKQKLISIKGISDNKDSLVDEPLDSATVYGQDGSDRVKQFESVDKKVARKQKKRKLEKRALIAKPSGSVRSLYTVKEKELESTFAYKERLSKEFTPPKHQEQAYSVRYYMNRAIWHFRRVKAYVFRRRQDNTIEAVTEDKSVKKSITPICILPQTLTDGVCQSPTPVISSGALDENLLVLEQDIISDANELQKRILVCISPQILNNGRCETPESEEVLTAIVGENVVKPNQDPVVNTVDISVLSDSFPDTYTLPTSGFTKVCNNGLYAGQGSCPLEPSLGNHLEEWACTRDNSTGLIWEVKTNDVGERNLNRIYTNYSEIYNPIGSFGSESDASGYVVSVNAIELCGANDWGLPSGVELLGLLNNLAVYPAPMINLTYFPNTVASAFWSSSVALQSVMSAWFVYFDDGFIGNYGRENLSSIRLVRDDSN